jgi:glycosyltransferase involved in cell wall biosynthesis
MARARQLGIEDAFRSLGVVPYLDLVVLMKESVAIINPSLFEGWSTTVEEAKSMGKAVILSDIPVHREQAPPRGIYFNPHDSAELARTLWKVWNAWDAETESQSNIQAAHDLSTRRDAFATKYERIVLELVNRARQ